MLTITIQRALRTNLFRAVASQTPRPSSAFRTFSVLGPRYGELDKDFFGPGAKPGTVPTDLEQATGPERAELLANLEGKSLWDMKPLELTHMGTKKDPIIVKSVDPERYVGCTGYPVDSHEMIWLVVDKNHEFDRCPECGQVYKLNFVGTESHGHGHH
ncbi:8283_t:CDS:2 [Diversispora eburnea]|uniref:8283_t:CDS:1 n=1 Tax=Diversispora eburnea TaxID=1213867 RepID=A0A9N9BJI4_9GLOM|nr:8283_t:CDS:2 [Diversispora eburnea]